MKRVIGWGIIILILLIFLEICSFAFYRLVILPRASFLIYQPPETIEAEAYAHYLERRDDVLGWPPSSRKNESRPTPSFPAATDNCISLYGDSFVYADEVPDEAAWGNLLSEALGCRVGNFGVGGYGTDQAYLRFLDNPDDVAPVTILGIYPQNGLRNVNQYRLLLTGGERFGFKPRFILQDDVLELVPIPQLAYEELDSFYQAPAQYLSHEAFLPDTASGPLIFSFPYTVSLIQLLTKERLVNRLLGRPSWTAFWQPEHPTQSLEVAVAIVAAFYEMCDARNKACLTIIFPTPASYEWFAESNVLGLQALTAAVEARGRAIVDLTPGLAQKLQGDDFCAILTEPALCQGHFNAEGNRLVAEVVLEHLGAMGLTPASAP